MGRRVEYGNAKHRGGVLHSVAAARQSFALLFTVVYLAEDLYWDEELVSEVVAAMQDFTGHQRIKAGYSYMQGSPILGYA